MEKPVETQSFVSEELSAIIAENRKLFSGHFDHEPTVVGVAPGRINIIGEHTDYSEGLSMPVAINRWVIFCVSKRADNRVCVVSENFKSRMEFELGSEISTTASWEKFIKGCVELFVARRELDFGFNAVISGNIPIGAGVSSSAAIELAIINALNELYGAEMTDQEIAIMGQQVEHQYLQVKCGLLDQFASQFTKYGQVMILDFRTLTRMYTTIKMEGYSWVLVNSMVKRELAGSEYSKRVDEMERARQVLKANGISHLREAKLSDLNLIDDEKVKMRLRHFITANQRVAEMRVAFEELNYKRVGELLNESHRSLSEDYEVSCHELDVLATDARKIKGCYGSRMMGGGFGGCTLNLVDNSCLEEFSYQIKRQYKIRFNMEPDINSFTMVDGAQVFRSANVV